MERLRSVKWFTARSVLKTGNWVAENYLCWARCSAAARTAARCACCAPLTASAAARTALRHRLLPWFFSDLNRAVPTAAYVAPQRPFSEYTKKMNQEYLRACGAVPSSYCDMDPGELKLHVAELRASDDPPTIDSTNVTAADVQTAAALLCATTARVMQPTVSDAHAADTDAHVKAYLTSVDIIDAGHRGDKKPIWLSRANHLTALNTGEVMRQNGAVNRNCWGGGYGGEKGIREMKAHTGPIQGAWPQRMMNSVYTARGARLLGERHVPERHDHVKVLGSAATELAAKPACIQLVRHCHIFGIVVARNRTAASVTLEPVAHVPGTLTVSACGVAFWQWDAAGERTEAPEAGLEHWVLLAAHDGSGKYYACGDTWCEVGSEGQVSLPSVFAAVRQASERAHNAAAAAAATAAAARAATAADRQAAVSEAAEAHAHAVSSALAELHNKGISKLSGNKCRMLSRALFGTNSANKNAPAHRSHLRAELESASSDLVASKLELKEGLRFEMVFEGDSSRTVYPAELTEVRGGDKFKCVYDDGDEKEHSSEQLRAALEEQPMHMR